MTKQVVVLGGGVGGTLAANLLAKKLSPDEVQIRLVDATGQHHYQPGWLYLALDKAESRWLSKDLRGLVNDNIELLIDTATAIDAEHHRLYLDRIGPIDYDYLVIATGARLDRAAVPGLEATHDFYSLRGAQRLRESLRTIESGRLIIGTLGLPIKSPGAPVEFAFLVEEHLRKRDVRKHVDIRFVSPLERVIQYESVAQLVEPLLRERDITLHTSVVVDKIDPERKQLLASDGEVYGFDLAVLVPPHRGSRVVEDSGMGDAQGWLATDPATLRVKGYADVFALGDCTDLPVSKNGSTAHFEAPVIVEQIAARVEGRSPDPVKSRYRGKVIGFLEVGGRKATMLVLDYESPPKPPKPSIVWHAAKWAFNRAYWFTVPKGRI